MRKLLLLCCFILASCGEDPPPPPEEVPDKLVLKPVTFDDLPLWGADDFDGFAQAFGRSCARIAKNDPAKQFGALEAAGTYGSWQDICKKFESAAQTDLKTFFEANFTPHAVFNNEEQEGLFTGYYEASLRGSREKTDLYNIPLYKRPDDLVMVHLGEFREDLKGVRIAGRVKNGTLKPYETREDIVKGDWPHNDEVLVWVDNAVDAFFVQIQGSGIITLENDSTMRIGYAGQNGHPYHAIGRTLIDMGAIKKEDISMQSIRAWLEQNPEQADEIMNTNASYVFFRELKGEGPIGGEGVALTAERSLAVDRTLISYGLPLWVDLQSPKEGAENMTRLMIAQDTGGAIRGPVRGDFFWGFGKHAEDMAGKMKSKGRYWALLPKKASTAQDNPE